MQISKVPEVAGCGEGCVRQGGDAPDYQTASELFELMTKNTQFDTVDNYSLSAEDLVLLYQNIDIGTKLMNDASEVAVRKPNQYVETVVYNDDHESSSDCSEIFTPNDIQDVFMLNQERINFFNDKSLENVLSHKFGGLDMHTSNLTYDYDKSFLFQDPYIKNQLQNLNLLGTSSEFDNLISTSLIDYICCKRLEDNYNFYMDNIIRYVQHTIEQLKRISNGDYLTDRTREKWMEVNSNTEQENNTKVLATSTSIPLHVECKANGDVTWDDIVHSEVDVRSLSKILEKKIIVEIPKLICGSYRLYSKRCADNVIISCQREQQKIEKKGQESRVDVVLQLQRSETGQVMSNISSIMVLKTTPTLPDIRGTEILPLPFKEKTDERTIQHIKEDLKEPAITIIELIRDPEPIAIEQEVKDITVEEISEDNDDYQDSQNEDSGINDYPFSDRIASYASMHYSSESSLAVRDTIDRPVFSSCDKADEKTYNLISPDELHMTMRRLNMQNSALNESSEDTVSRCTSKKRSPVRMRIKSPYENKSFLMEEKKRKRLLEIRDKREKKKIALSESCKITKHKYGKGAMMPQASSSVTKLSITNKSFYNSIYGQNTNVENKPKLRKPMKSTPDVSITIDETQEDAFESPALTPDKNSKKYINRSYYLDDAETEMMYIQMKKNENKDLQHPCSASDSNISNEFNASLDILKELMSTSETILTDDPTYLTGGKLHDFTEVSCSGGTPLFPIAETVMALSTTPTTQNNTKKSSSSDECRKSIDQLYDLMNKFGKSNVPAGPKPTNVDLNNLHIIQGSESGTSVKHINAPCDSPGRSNMAISKLKPNKGQPTGAPKAVTNSKIHSPHTESDNRMRKDRNRRPVVSPPMKVVPENPLKAISQLLHEFDRFDSSRKQKNRQREVKSPKKVETAPNDVKTNSRQGFFRRKSRIDQHLKDQEKKAPPPYNINPKDKRLRPMTPLELARNPHKQIPVEDRNADKIPQKKIADIIDEAKEARGEAVRGPSKNNSRLNSLAQPKKSYVQAHHEEYQNRYGRNVLAERLQKLATTPAPAAVVERNVSSPTTSNRNRWRKSGTEAATAPMKQRTPTVPQLEQQKAAMSTRKRRSSSSSPETVTRLVPSRHTGGGGEGPEASDVICKMVAVESYVHSHYGTLQHSEELGAGLRCRVPLVPQDDLASVTSGPSADEAARLGDSLRRMVDSVVSPPALLAPHLPAPRLAALAALAECAESIARSDPPRSESDYCVDILEDCHVTTAVGALHAESFSSYGQHPASSAEMDQLETALYSHISGSFQKRLRIKNLTLTPKPSMQQVFLLQSGDASTVLVKSVSNLKLKTKSTESLHDLKTMPVLSNSHLDWTFTQLPMQIATVGYAFPEHRPQNTGSKVKLIEMSSSPSYESTVEKLCQSSQCVRGLSPRLVRDMRDSGAQVDVVTQRTSEMVATSVENLEQTANSQTLETEPTEVVNETHVGTLVTVNEVESESDANKAIEEINNGVKKEILMGADEESASKLAPALAPAQFEPETISYTTSLDMLVGLLTEIQKITCQNQMVASDQQTGADFQTMTLQTSNNTIAVNKVGTACELISISSLENLRQLESNASIYSYYLSNDEESTNSVEPVLELKRNSQFTENSLDTQPLASACVIKEHVAVGASKPTVVDKEVSANLCDGRADMCTNIPPVVDRGTEECGALCAASEPSSLSSLAVDYRTPHSSTTRTPAVNETIELPQIEREQHALISRDKTDLNEQCFTTLSIRHIEDVKKESLIGRGDLRCCVRNIDLDPMFKIKRDLLVSMYSILVLTVFAALSFPELLIFES